MAPDVFVRRARPQDAVAISRLNNTFADEGLMLLRTPEMIALAIDDYVVVQDAARRDPRRAARSRSIRRAWPRSRRSPCRARRMARDWAARSCSAVEELARKRGIYDVFALTLQPEFFAAIGYQRVDRARYPEKIRRDCLGVHAPLRVQRDLLRAEPAGRGAVEARAA